MLTNKLTKAKKVKIATDILVGVGNIVDRPKTKEGHLDVKAFNELPLVIFATKRLKSLGIDREWLAKNGFVIASLILTFNNKKKGKK